MKALFRFVFRLFLDGDVLHLLFLLAPLLLRRCLIPFTLQLELARNLSPLIYDLRQFLMLLLGKQGGFCLNGGLLVKMRSSISF
jgi:hypothetical protein